MPTVSRTICFWVHECPISTLPGLPIAALQAGPLPARLAAYNSRSYDRMKDALRGRSCYPAVMTQSGDLSTLPVADRLKLIEDLWDSIEVEASDLLPLPEWHRNEVERRLDALDAGASIGAPWSEVRGRITGGR